MLPDDIKEIIIEDLENLYNNLEAAGKGSDFKDIVNQIKSDADSNKVSDYLSLKQITRQYVVDKHIDAIKSAILDLIYLLDGRSLFLKKYISESYAKWQQNNTEQDWEDPFYQMRPEMLELIESESVVLTGNSVVEGVSDISLGS